MFCFLAKNYSCNLYPQRQFFRKIHSYANIKSGLKSCVVVIVFVWCMQLWSIATDWFSTFSLFLPSLDRKHIMSSFFTSFTALEKILITISVISGGIQGWHLYRFKSEHVKKCWSHILREAQKGNMSYRGKTDEQHAQNCFCIISWMCVSYKAFGFSFLTFII